MNGLLDAINGKKGNLKESETVDKSAPQIGKAFKLDEKLLDEQVTKLVERINKAKYIVAFTGAGVSASAGLGTFRGVGKGNACQVREDLFDCVFPTFSHLALNEMLRSGQIKHIVTSNHDNLHIKAGANEADVSELFGNGYVETCLKCKKQFRRTTVCPSLNRKCEECGGALKKSGVRYGQRVPEAPTKAGFEQAKKCDLALVLGSGMHTGPFCDMPPLAKQFYLVNLGPTKADHHKNAIKIDAPCDLVMKRVCEKLNVNVPQHEFHQKFYIGWNWKDDSKQCVEYFVQGFNENEAVTFATTMQVTLPNGMVREDDRNSIDWTFKNEFRFNPDTANSSKLVIRIEPREEYTNAKSMKFKFEIDVDKDGEKRTGHFKYLVEHSI